MLEKLVQAAIIFLITGGLAYVGGLALAHMLESAQNKRLDLDALDARIQRYARLAQQLQARKEAMLPRLVKLDAALKSARRRQYMVTRKLNDLKIARSQLTRVLGEEDAFLRPERPARKFIAHIVNRHVQRAQLDQKEHPLLSKVWARTQPATIWAPTIGDAKAMAERAYPPATGFFISEISEPQGEDEDLGPLEEAALATAMEMGSRE